MSGDNTPLAMVSNRLGLRENVALYKKAEEFLRILQTKSSIKTVNEFCKAVLCLDLAASMLGEGFDKETALKLSGVKKPVYQKSLNILEKLLEIGKPLTISEACVQLGCTAVKELAEKLFNAYKQHESVRDFTHPQYVVASISTACKLRGIKVQKPDFVQMSRLKPGQWKQLETEFTDFASKNGFGTEAKRKTGKNELHTYLEEHAQNDRNISPKKKPLEEKPIEEYEVWKQRILAEAREQLKKLNT